jgi:hypothetical protein
MNSEAVVFFHDSVSTKTRINETSQGGVTLTVEYHSEGQRFETMLFFNDLRSVVEAVCEMHSKVLDFVVAEWEGDSNE